MAERTQVVYLDPRTIAPDPDNVRRDGPGDVEALAASIRTYGLLQPIGVAPDGDGYRVVYGNRRREAAIRAGLAAVPCIVVDGTPADRLICQLVENLQRQALNDLDQAEGLARLRRYLDRQQPGQSARALDDAVGQLVGLSGATVRRYLGLRHLAPGVRDLIAEGQLTVTQAQHLAAIPDPHRQEAVAQLAVERGLSAAAIARACRAAQARPNLAPAQAVDLAEQGVEPEPAVVPKVRGPQRLPRPPRAQPEDDADLWSPDEAAPAREGPAEPVTADGHRRFRIRTVSAFCDEVDRLARCLQEGDLAKAVPHEPDAALRLRLAARQLEYVQRALHEFLRQRGWADERAASTA